MLRYLYASTGQQLITDRAPKPECRRQVVPWRGYRAIPSVQRDALTGLPEANYGDLIMVLEMHGTDFSQQVLRTDVAGMPLEWIDYRDAVRLYHTEQVAYTCGTPLYEIRGGICAATGMRSTVEVNSIIATVGKNPSRAELRDQYVPPLNNKTLFRRDGHLCMYCGNHFMSRDMTRDHVRPLSQGGADHWTNVVTACRRCNNHKGGRTPEQSRMELIAIPFSPTYAEYIYLKGRRVLADQMEFLLAHIPRSSPLHSRLATTLREESSDALNSTA